MTTKGQQETEWQLADHGEILSSEKNAFTVDVEEWFQVGAFETTFSRSDWVTLESRVELQTRALLYLLSELSIQGTFFCLGWVAERYPLLLADIAKAGHEIACHGVDHRRLFTLTEEEFRTDVRQAKRTLELASGKKVVGYRAPSFSLTQEVWWAYKVLSEEGFTYSSSLYPVKTDHYGMQSAPRNPFYPLGDNGLLEIPMTVCDVPFLRVPASGGGYFRLLPYGVSHYLLKQGVKQADVPGIFYMHPWEMDTDQPYVKEAPWLSKFRHYNGQAKLPQKLARIAHDFKWGRVKDIYRPLFSVQGEHK